MQKFSGRQAWGAGRPSQSSSASPVLPASAPGSTTWLWAMPAREGRSSTWPKGSVHYVLFLQSLWGWGRRDSRNPWWPQYMCVISCQPGDGHQGTAGLALDLAASQAALSLLPSPLGPWLSEAMLRRGVLWPYTPQSPWPALLPLPATAPACPFSLRRTTTEARFSPCHIALDPQSGFQYSVPSSGSAHWARAKGWPGDTVRPMGTLRPAPGLLRLPLPQCTNLPRTAITLLPHGPCH